MESKDTSRKRKAIKACSSVGSVLNRPFRSAEDGATLVEFALSASILFAMVFGIIMMSLALYTYDFVADAARIATRYAIVRGGECTGFPECASGGANESQIQNYVRSIAYPGIDPNQITVNASWYTILQSNTAPTSLTLCATSTPGNCNMPGSAVRVQVTYTFPLSIPYWRATTLTMSARSQLVVSQ